MYSLAPPQRNGLQDFDSIVAQRNSIARTLLKQNRSDIAQAYCKYITQSGNGAFLDPISVAEEVAGLLKANFRLLDRGRSHDFMRDEVLESARFDACPYCNFTIVDSIDHALPRAVYPEYSVLVQNLVPACGKCNRKKGDVCFKSSGVNLMHPYFVHIPDDPILFAKVVVDANKVTWAFYLRKTPGIEDAQFESIENLFNVLGLADRYYQVSLGDVMDRIGQLEQLQEAGGAGEVKRYFEMEAESSRRSRGDNYWKTAILQALADSVDFCNGGHRLLG